MTEVRQSSSQQHQSLRWTKTFVGVILAALLLFVLFKELHSLSKGLEETRKSLHELSNRLAEEKEKNEKLRKELGRVKERMDNILQVFSNLQKVSRVKRSKEAHNCSGKLETRCKRLKHCAKKLIKDVNCTMVKNCMPSRRKDHLHAYKLKASTLQNIQDPKQKIKNEGAAKVQLSWQEYISSDSIIAFEAQFNISTGGIYYIYCHLRVSRYVKRIVVRTSSSELFSTLPSFTSNSKGVVQMSGLAVISRYTLLYVEAEFDNSVLKKETGIGEQMNHLFPNYFNKEQSPNSFGMFLVS